MIVNFNRVLKPRGTAIVLTTQIEAVQRAIKQTKLSIVDEIEVYVGGQKAFVIKLIKR
jgi:uncharacterized protein YpmB